MARIDKNKKLRPSILDRLIDNEPNKADNAEIDQHQRLKELRNSVRRDLINLLNTRVRIVQPDEAYSELNLSLLNYGLPDLATVNILDSMKRKSFIEQLESLLMEFESRFKSVSVNYLENTDLLDRTLRFRIDATLYADPSPEMVVFDSFLDPVSRIVNIEETGHD